VPFSGGQTDLTHLLCVIFTFEGVIKGLKNWLRMAKKRSLLQNSIFECDQASGHDFSRAERGAKGNLAFSPCNLVFSYLQFRSG
jgi:hypothetical protein